MYTLLGIYIFVYSNLYVNDDYTGKYTERVKEVIYNTHIRPSLI